MAGHEPQLVRNAAMSRYVCASLVLLLIFAINESAYAQTLYKYRGADGEWIYTDRQPDEGEISEVRKLQARKPETSVSVTHEVDGRTISLMASNQFYAPVELSLDIQETSGLRFPESEREFRWTLPARSETVLLSFDALSTNDAPSIQYQFTYLPGDPKATHRPTTAYRVPFAIASDFPVSQAYPDTATHGSPDSFHAVDIVMPIGTDIFAARAGVVFDVASTNFRTGQDVLRDGPAANVVRILHDDGTYAIYAHLNWNTIRVRPGQRVARGEYIADSGNTGFSSGPHLHFAVLQNRGLWTESLPIVFEGANATAVSVATGAILTAY